MFWRNKVTGVEMIIPEVGGDRAIHQSIIKVWKEKFRVVVSAHE